MSNEITKLYSLAGVEPVYPYTKCYPEFTAEKQLRITKLIGLHYGLKFIINEGMDHMFSTGLYNDRFDKQGYGGGYNEAIANLTINLWQDLTESEQNEIREILR